MDRLGSLDHFYDFKRDVLAVQAIEQSCAAAEQHRDEVNRDFANESAFEKLPCNVCACYVDILIPCQLFGSFKRGFYAINERVHASIGYIPWSTV